MRQVNSELRNALQAVQRAITTALDAPEPMHSAMRVPADAEEYKGNRLAWLLNRYGEEVMGEQWKPYEAYDELGEDLAEELLILLGGEPDGAYVVLDADGTYRVSMYEASVGTYDTYEDAIDAVFAEAADIRRHAPAYGGTTAVWFVSFVPGNETRLKIMKGI